MFTIYDYDTLHGFLEGLLLSKKKNNPMFSLRALARDLDISPSQLNKIINQKSHVSDISKEKISSYLNFSPEEDKYFNLIISLSGSSPDSAKLIKEQIKLIQIQKMSVTQNIEKSSFELGWEHLLLITLSEYRNSKKLILTDAQRILEIPFIDAEFIYEQLIKSRLINENKDGTISPGQRKFTVEHTQNNHVLKKMHENFLNKSIDLLHKNSPKERFSATEVINISQDNFNEAIRLSNEYLDKLYTLISDDKPTKELTTVGVSLHLNQIKP